MTVKILPYKAGSASARALADSMGVRRLKLRGSRWRGRGVDRDTVINWGCNDADLLPAGSYRIINHPDVLSTATNKLEFFQTLAQSEDEVIRNALPDWTQDQTIARQWIEEGAVVVCRTLLRANSGRGIVIASSVDELVRAPLYVKYVKKQDEYRTHATSTVVFDTQRKMRRRDVADDDVNWQVRNMENGFIFGREGVTDDPRRDALALRIINALQLDFGAIDLVYNRHQDKYYVLEVNTAPGLTGTTLNNYTDILSEI